MTAAVLALSLTAFLLAAIIAGLGLWARAALQRAGNLQDELDASGYRALVGQRIVANLAEGPVIRGVLAKVYVDAVVIAHPEYIAGERPAGLGAEVTLARSSVPMLQRFDSAASA